MTVKKRLSKLLFEIICPFLRTKEEGGLRYKKALGWVKPINNKRKKQCI